MVVRIRLGKTIRGALSYNEQKVAKGAADLILASGFSTDIKDLGFTQKLNRFLRLTERRLKTRANTLHISLNFSPAEILSNDKMNAIAKEYMIRLGFGNQPYLVYRHHDARHPHIHIITTNIKENGHSIPLNQLAKKKSEPARKAIEEIFSLVQAEKKKGQKPFIPSARDFLPAIYGKEETKHVITNIIGEVLRSYKFTTLAELNAILKQMNIVAYRGNPGSKMHEKGGLIYSLLDDHGFRTGIPIKASSIYGYNTLKDLHRKFPTNLMKKAASIKYTHNTVAALVRKSQSGNQFEQKLAEKGIFLSFEANQLGLVQAVRFVDHRNKVVFSHNELGLDIETLAHLYARDTNLTPTSPKPSYHFLNQRPLNRKHAPVFQFGNLSAQTLVNVLFQSPHGLPGPVGDFPVKKKKKRRGIL